MNSEIQNEIIQNWKTNHKFLGLKRFRLESLSSSKLWETRKVIASMRKNKIICLNKRNYFINLSKLEVLNE